MTGWRAERLKRRAAYRQRDRSHDAVPVFAVVPPFAAAWVLRHVPASSIRNEAAWLRARGRPRSAGSLEVAVEQLEQAAEAHEQRWRDG